MVRWVTNNSARIIIIRKCVIQMRFYYGKDNNLTQYKLLYIRIRILSKTELHKIENLN